MIGSNVTTIYLQAVYVRIGVGRGGKPIKQFYVNKLRLQAKGNLKKHNFRIFLEGGKKLKLLIQLKICK